MRKSSSRNDSASVYFAAAAAASPRTNSSLPSSRRRSADSSRSSYLSSAIGHDDTSRVITSPSADQLCRATCVQLMCAGIAMTQQRTSGRRCCRCETERRAGDCPPDKGHSRDAWAQLTSFARGAAPRRRLPTPPAPRHTAGAHWAAPRETRSCLWAQNTSMK